MKAAKSEHFRNELEFESILKVSTFNWKLKNIDPIIRLYNFPYSPSESHHSRMAQSAQRWAFGAPVGQKNNTEL